jgi:hypothetical protein
MSWVRGGLSFPLSFFALPNERSFESDCTQVIVRDQSRSDCIKSSSNDKCNLISLDQSLFAWKMRKGGKSGLGTQLGALRYVSAPPVLMEPRMPQPAPLGQSACPRPQLYIGISCGCARAASSGVDLPAARAAVKELQDRQTDRQTGSALLFKQYTKHFCVALLRDRAALIILSSRAPAAHTPRQLECLGVLLWHKPIVLPLLSVAKNPNKNPKLS